MPNHWRADGALAVAIWAHVVPSNSHVWLRYGGLKPVPPRPPNNTIRSRTKSWTIWKCPRGPGDVGGVSCVHVWPSKVQVSLRKPGPASAPPKTTVRLRSTSKVMPP